MTTDQQHCRHCGRPIHLATLPGQRYVWVTNPAKADDTRWCASPDKPVRVHAPEVSR